MKRRFTVAALVLVAVVAAAQLIRPGMANPPVDLTRTIQAHVSTTGLGVVLDRSCGACHSNGTEWPWYTQIAPVSWLVAYGVAEGRDAVNFSEWAAYSPDQQRTLLAASCLDATNGTMPGRAWTLVHPEARLSTQDIETICAAARQVEAKLTEGLAVARP